MAAVMLLLAQLGGMSHAYSHVPSVSPELKQPLQNAHTFCSDCLNFAPLLAPMASAPVAAVIPPPTHASAAASPPTALLEAKLRLAFRSRAPPTTSTH